MFYVIDFDTCTIESKSPDGELLASYIVDNNLGTAVALIDSEDELCLQFSLGEMQELSDGIGGKRKYESEEEASEWCWRLLNECEDDFPSFTKSLGKRLLKSARSRNKDSESTNAPKTPRTRKTSSTGGNKRLTDATVLVTGSQPKLNTSLYKVWQIVEDNFGEMSVGEIVAEYSTLYNLEERLIKRYINKIVRLGNLGIMK